MTLGGILTAMVTPFGEDGEIDEEAFVDLLRHLLEGGGSDGVVVAGTTGEGSTMSDEEKCRLWELAVAEAAGAPVIAGTGSNDTKHSAELTERATAIGVDAVLAVTPYYNKPNQRGIVEHYRAIAASTDRPVVLYNIPSRVVVDVPNELLEELAEIDNVEAVKQANPDNLASIPGLDLLAGNDDLLARTMDMGGTGGILVSSHLVGHEMQRIVHEPESRQGLQEGIDGVLRAVSAPGVTTNPIPIKAALNMLGRHVGGLRLPLVEASEEEQAAVRQALERHGLLTAA